MAKESIAKRVSGLVTQIPLRRCRLAELPVELRLLIFKDAFFTTPAEIDNEGAVHHQLLDPVFTIFHDEIYDTMYHCGAPILLPTFRGFDALRPFQLERRRRSDPSFKARRVLIQPVHEPLCFECTLQNWTRGNRRPFRYMSTCDSCEQDTRMLLNMLRWDANLMYLGHVDFLEPRRRPWQVPWTALFKECIYGVLMILLFKAVLFFLRLRPGKPL